MHVKPFCKSSLAAGVLLVAANSTSFAQQPQPGLEAITKDNAIKGEMTIHFNSRKPAGNEPKVDLYQYKLNIADFLSLDGTSQRTPQTQIEYNVKLLAHNPKNVAQTKHVAQMKGVMGIDSQGKYLLRGTPKVEIPDAQRLQITMLTAVQGLAKDNYFDGAIQGKQPKTKGWFQRFKEAAKIAKEYTRNIGGKTVKLTVQNPDIMRFEDLKLAAGPWPTLTEVTVGGSLDFDYASSNWLTEGISMKYTLDGKPVEDIITGSIRFVEETGKFKAEDGQEKDYNGYYDFNLRYNEAQHAGKPVDEAFFGDGKEDPFFAEDKNVPALLGRIYYYDTDQIGSGDEEVPGQSQIYYALKANQLNAVQLANFTKLWLLAIGPTNDE